MNEHRPINDGNNDGDDDDNDDSAMSAAGWPDLLTMAKNFFAENKSYFTPINVILFIKIELTQEYVMNMFEYKNYWIPPIRLWKRAIWV